MNLQELLGGMPQTRNAVAENLVRLTSKFVVKLSRLMQQEHLVDEFHGWAGLAIARCINKYDGRGERAFISYVLKSISAEIRRSAITNVTGVKYPEYCQKHRNSDSEPFLVRHPVEAAIDVEDDIDAPSSSVEFHDMLNILNDDELSVINSWLLGQSIYQKYVWPGKRAALFKSALSKLEPHLKAA